MNPEVKLPISTAMITRDCILGAASKCALFLRQCTSRVERGSLPPHNLNCLSGKRPYDQASDQSSGRLFSSLSLKANFYFRMTTGHLLAHRQMQMAIHHAGWGPSTELAKSYGYIKKINKKSIQF